VLVTLAIADLCGQNPGDPYLNSTTVLFDSGGLLESLGSLVGCLKLVGFVLMLLGAWLSKVLNLLATVTCRVAFD